MRLEKHSSLKTMQYSLEGALRCNVVFSCNGQNQSEDTDNFRPSHTEVVLGLGN
jgi:hypothetical protein